MGAPSPIGVHFIFLLPPGVHQSSQVSRHQWNAKDAVQTCHATLQLPPLSSFLLSNTVLLHSLLSPSIQALIKNLSDCSTWKADFSEWVKVSAIPFPLVQLQESIDHKHFKMSVRSKILKALHGGLQSNWVNIVSQKKIGWLSPQLNHLAWLKPTPLHWL